MGKKNIFNDYINGTGEENDTATVSAKHETPNEESIPEKIPLKQEKQIPSSVPYSIIPWNNNELTKKLEKAGYTSVKLIATATVEEIHAVTGIPKENIKNLLEKAKEWSDFNFESAASLLEDRSLLHRIPTGSGDLDQILGGGIEPKSITEFYGAFTTGKTQLCTQLAVNVALPEDKGGMGGNVVYIDTEGSFRPERIVQILSKTEIDVEEVLDKILVGRAHNSNIQMQLLNNTYKLAQQQDIGLIIVDSLTSNFRAEYIGKDALMERQQKLNQHVQQLSRIADMLNVAVVITNQVLSVIDGFENTVMPVGGNILAHGSTHRIHLIKSTKDSTVRYAKLVASPSLPDNQAAFRIVHTGIEDLEIG